MTARVWHGVTRESNGERFHEYIMRTGVKDCRATNGNCGVLILRRTHQGRTHFLFVSLWESFEAVRHFAGNDIEKAVYYPEDENLLLELEPTVAHYDVLTNPVTLFNTDNEPPRVAI